MIAGHMIVTGNGMNYLHDDLKRRLRGYKIGEVSDSGRITVTRRGTLVATLTPSCYYLNQNIPRIKEAIEKAYSEIPLGG